jgi:pimeloyl-ACP methyl ester carboxylesterase
MIPQPTLYVNILRNRNTSMRPIGVCFAAFLFLLAMATSVSAAPPSHANNPLVLDAQGNFYVGGTIELRSPNTTNAALPGDGTAPGHIAVNQANVQYQIPVAKKYKYPLVLMHGGGHTANIFMSTPDGREGWFTSFTRRGFAVYAVDGPNRGRSGWDPTARIQATVGLAPASSMEGVNIYTEEGAWTGFRWGPTFGTFYPNTQFPKAYVEEYIRQIQPAYRNLPAPAEQVQNNLMAADLRALVDKIGPCILLGWSTGSLNVMSAASSPVYAAKIKGLIGIEGFTASSGGDPAVVKTIPQLTVIADHRDPAPNQAWSALINSLGGDSTTVYLPDVGIFGNGHTMMAELNNEQIADLIENWIKQHVH